MPQCPNCGTNLKDEYGMSQCPSCRAFLFIDMDGIAHIERGDGAPAASKFDQLPPTFESQETAESEFSGFVPQAEPEPVSEPAPELVEDARQEFDISQPPAFTDLPDPESQVKPKPPPVRHPKPTEFGSAEDPLSLKEFANSEISAGKTGPLLFRILISGIDTKEIRQSIREALQDQRFAWDAEAIYAQISRGDLVIENVPPVKASIFVSRVKRLPVKIRWEQYAISQIEGP